MGYGHQRAAYPLKNLAVEEEIVNANDYLGISKKDRKIWETTRKGYELISKFKKIPLIGEFGFFIFDQFQKILSFYPKRDLSNPNFQLKQTFSLIRKGWGEYLIKKLSAHQPEPPPLISTFFAPAFMAEYFSYPGQIFCLICDADISRAWAPFNSKTSRIKYFAPTERVAERLKLYGVKEENIFLTGFPLPLENTGSENLEILKNDLKYRLLNLDPQKRFFRYYEPLTKKYLGNLPQKPNHPLTLMFAVGGAGAQKEIGIKILKCLKINLKKDYNPPTASEVSAESRRVVGGSKSRSFRERAPGIKIILSAGIKKEVKEYFLKNIKNLGLKNHLGKEIEILFEENIESYFRSFNLALRKTDILWTKPSELSFYSVLGIPIIIAPPIGSQEEFNKRWLLKSGFGLLQENPNYVHQWLFDWLEKGYLAEAAMQGFIEGEKLGTYKIEKIISKNG